MLPDELWLRPADLSATLTAVASDPILRPRLAADAVGVLAFHLGGAAALALVGARIDGQRYARSCDRGETGMDCAWFAHNGIDLHGIDIARAGRSNLDRRVRAATVIDPELSEYFDPASLSAVSVPLQIAVLGAPDGSRPRLAAARLARAIPGAGHDAIAGAISSSAFELCKPQGPAILREEGDEARCQDGERPRAEVHALLARMTASFLRARVQSGR